MFVLLAFAVFFAGGSAALQQAHEESTIPRKTIINESWTVDQGSYVTLSNSKIGRAIYLDNETVRNESDVRMVEGLDYEWNSSRGGGRVRALQGGDLANGTTATISYSYGLPTDTKEGLNNIIGSVYAASPSLIPIIMVLALIAVGRMVTT